MNFQYWKGELTLFEEESFLENDDDGICMIADTQASPVTIVVEPDYEIKIEEHEGREYITLHKKKVN